MFSRKTLVAWISLVVLASLLLAACGPAATPAPEPTQAPAAEEATEAPEPTAEPEEEEVVEIEATPTAEVKEWEGEIVISLNSSDQQTWQAMADAYMAQNPKVDVMIELKAGSTDDYSQWVYSQFAAGDVPRVSIIEYAHIGDLISEGKILNLGPYLNQENPYSGNMWEDDFQDWSLDILRDPSTGEMYQIAYTSVQTFWVYNKSIFEEVGITDVPGQPTYDQWVEWLEKIKAAGYIGIAQEGTTDRMWGGGKMPWTMRSAMDQYRRADINIVRCQEGDWCFREGIDDVWTYDPTNPRNDTPQSISVNVVRHLQALRDGEIRFDQPWFVDMMEHVATVFKTSNGYVPEGWNGLTDAYPLFLTQKAAMLQTSGSFFTTFPKDIARLAEGAYYAAPEDGEAPTPSAEELAATQFEYGVFSFPTIVSDYAEGIARANELTSGNIWIPKKDRAQNDLEVDFLMFWLSPQGMSIYLENKLDPNNLQGGIAGPPIVNNVELPAEWEEVFANVTYIGNYEYAGAPGDKVARGFYLYEPTKREWALMVQQFFNEEITAEEFAQKYQQMLEDYWPEILEYLNVTDEDLDHPEKMPPDWVATMPF